MLFHEVPVRLPVIMSVPEGATALPLSLQELVTLQKLVQIALLSEGDSLERSERAHAQWIGNRIGYLFAALADDAVAKAEAKG